MLEREKKSQTRLFITGLNNQHETNIERCNLLTIAVRFVAWLTWL